MGRRHRQPAATPAEVIAARGTRTQKQIADLLQVTRNTVQNWERGRAPIPHLAYKEMLATKENAPCPAD